MGKERFDLSYNVCDIRMPGISNIFSLRKFERELSLTEPLYDQSSINHSIRRLIYDICGLITNVKLLVKLSSFRNFHSGLNINNKIKYE